MKLLAPILRQIWSTQPKLYLALKFESHYCGWVDEPCGWDDPCGCDEG